MEKNNDYIKFEEDFLLLHKLLSCLKNAGFSIPAVSRQDYKRVVVNSYKHESSHLFLTSLIGVVNFGFDKYESKGNGDIFWRNKLDLDIADLGEDTLDYSIEQVSKAVDILEFNGDVTTDIPQKDNFPQNKNVVLTKQGFNAFASNKYLKLAKDESYSVELHNSTIRANYFAIGSGIGAVIFAALAFWVSSLQYCNQTKSISPEDLKELKTELSKIASQKTAIDTVWLKNSSNYPNSKIVDEKTNGSDSAKK